MALNSLGLGFVFTAKDMASPVMAKVEGRFKRLDTTTAAGAAGVQKAMVGLGAGFAVAAVGAVGLGVAAKAANAFGTFEQELARVGAITRATGGELDQLRDRAIKAGIETQFSPDEAVQGLTELGQRGFTAKESIDALGGALDFSSGASIGVAQGSATMAAALRVFGKDATYATDAADKLLKISNITAIAGGDLELMLGGVSRGASSTSQSLDEMLVSMGLVRNTGVDASVAASSVSSALQFIAKNQDQFKELGVSVTDSEGNFRDFLDIVMDTSAILGEKFPNQADRAAKGLDLFGRFGVSSFQAITTQATSGVRMMSGEMAYGADAIAYLRKEMEASAGTAQKFKEQLLDTFAGQKTLLVGSMQTLAVMVGEAFAGSFRLVTEGVISGVNSLIAVFQAIPGPIKKAIGGVFILVMALTLLAGLVMVGVALFTLLQAAVVAFAAPLIMAAQGLAVVAAAGIALVAVFKLLRYAFDKNIGGFGDSVRKVFDKVSLYFDALKQVMSGDGKLRGDVLRKLLDPENNGVLTMVQRMVQIGHRIKTFFLGIRDGFATALEGQGDTFKELGTAVTNFFAALGFGTDAVDGISTSSKQFGSTGQSLGATIGHIATILINGLTRGLEMATIGVEYLKAAWYLLGPSITIGAVMFKLMADHLLVMAMLLGYSADGANGLTGGIGGLTASLLSGMPVLQAAVDLLERLGIITDKNAKKQEGLGDAYRDSALAAATPFAQLEMAAEKRGISPEEYVKIRSVEISKEKGWSEEDARRALISGGDPFAAVNMDAEAAATSGIEAKKDGQVEDARGQEESTKSAFTAAMDEHANKARSKKPAKHTTIVNVDGVELVRQLEQSRAEAEAFDWEGATE